MITGDSCRDTASRPLWLGGTHPTKTYSGDKSPLADAFGYAARQHYIGRPLFTKKLYWKLTSKISMSRSGGFEPRIASGPMLDKRHSVGTRMPENR
jgi:hypothetical protein